jgi:hypothetical protein
MTSTQPGIQVPNWSLHIVCTVSLSSETWPRIIVTECSTLHRAARVPPEAQNQVTCCKIRHGDNKTPPPTERRDSNKREREARGTRGRALHRSTHCSHLAGVRALHRSIHSSLLAGMTILAQLHLVTAHPTRKETDHAGPETLKTVNTLRSLRDSHEAYRQIRSCCRSSEKQFPIVTQQSRMFRARRLVNASKMTIANCY